jgi:hypothetical protein
VAASKGPPGLAALLGAGPPGRGRGRGGPGKGIEQRVVIRGLQRDVVYFC